MNLRLLIVTAYLSYYNYFRIARFNQIAVKIIISVLINELYNLDR